MINRRLFLQLGLYSAISAKMMGHPLGVLSASSAQASAPGVLPSPIKGSLVAACRNLEVTGPYNGNDYGTVLSRFDLETGTIDRIPMDVHKPHDALKVKDQYLVIPNSTTPTMMVSDFSDPGKPSGQSIELPANMTLAGHGYYDDQNDVVIVASRDRDNERQGYFTVLDPDDFRILDLKKIEGRAPHDIQLLDANTFVVCNYNTLSSAYIDKTRPGYKGVMHDGYSYLSLYDRKTFALKKHIPAYKNAMVSHIAMTPEGDLYAIGFQEYRDPDLKSWTPEHIKEKFTPFFTHDHPELGSAWPQIVESLQINAIEYQENIFGLPLLPVRMKAGSYEPEIMPMDSFFHRRAQSICCVKQTGAICMAHPNSNTLEIYKPAEESFFTLSGDFLGIKEMRGITEIEGTSYVAVAGSKRGFVVIDTHDYEPIQSFDESLGYIIHMHHVV